MQGASRSRRFWEGFLGGSLAPGRRVVPHARLAGYRGVWLFVREDACVVSAPPDWCEPLESTLGDRAFDELLSPERLPVLFGEAFERAIGPSWLGRLDAGRFRERPSAAVAPASLAELDALRRSVPASDRENASLGEHDLFAWRDPGGRGERGPTVEIQAAASNRAWGDGVVGPGVLSRRPGCGSAVASAACRAALDRGDLVLYQTLRENERAVGLAQALGFEFEASHVAVRLRDVPPRT